MKKESIIRVLETIYNICSSYDGCRDCVWDKSCPYTIGYMSDEDNIERVAEVVKNTMDREDQSNGES